MLRAKNGDTDGAWDDILACHRLARLVAQGPCLIDRLLAITLEGMTWQGDADLLGCVPLTSAQAARIRDALAKLPPITTEADMYDVGERYCFLDGVGVAAREGFGRLFGEDEGEPNGKGLFGSFADAWRRAEIDWDVALRMGNPRYDRIVDACRKPTRAERLAAFEEIDAELKQMEAAMGNSRAYLLSFFGDCGAAASQQMGRGCVVAMATALSSVARVEDRAAMTAELGQLAFALAAYLADHGRYPARLAELSPAYVAEIPKDFFNHDADLHYAPQGEGYLLYSVGENGKDDGGRAYGEHDPKHPDDQCDDIVVRVPRGK